MQAEDFRKTEVGFDFILLCRPIYAFCNLDIPEFIAFLLDDFSI